MSIRAVDELAIEALRSRGRLTIKARGGSMTPFIRDGDIVVVANIEPTHVAVGDVVCYETEPGQLRLHRVVARDGDRLRVRGDAITFTEVVEGAQLLGKVICVQRHGTVSHFDTSWARWRNRAVASLSPAIPPLLSLALACRRRWRAVARG
jgi:signal peptidase I